MNTETTVPETTVPETTVPETTVPVIIATKKVDVTVPAKAMLSKWTPKIHTYRLDAIKKVNIIVNILEDKFVEYIGVTFNDGCGIDLEKLDDKVKNGVTDNGSYIAVNNITTMIKALPAIVAPAEEVAKYARPKKRVVTVDDLLNNVKISDTLKDMIAKEIDNI